ncbi:MAG TPA: hypothetical protein VGH28_01790 [Polyangiaceae bacterium]|jgi:hypothetical protein
MNRTALAIAFATFTASCILFVDRSPTGDSFATTCALADQTSACGACAAQSCASELSACCGSSGCRSQLPQFDQCADAGTCLVDESDPTTKTLAQCLDAQCPSVCAAGGATTSDGGGSNVGCVLDQANGSCSCETFIGANQTRCDTTTIPNGICCADVNWPAEGTSCDCEPVKCDSQIDGCMCSTSGSGKLASCGQGFGPCCASDTFCTCSSDNAPGCDQFSTPVSSCDVASVITCDNAQVQVNNCSIVP